jgi:hypothetical protein
VAAGFPAELNGNTQAAGKTSQLASQNKSLGILNNKR